MSSDTAMEFGDKHQERYAKVLEKWTRKVGGVEAPSDSLVAQWGADLDKALGEEVLAALLSPEALKKWIGVDLPSQDTLERYSKIAVKYSLNLASVDLLRRLVKSVKAEKDNKPESVTAALFRPSELIKRASQTVAQMFDMAKDQFNAVLNRDLERKQALTGRKRWVSTGDNSRHASLHHEIRDQGDTFTYKKQQISGPRPPGGSPFDWSNCSCYTELQRKDGTWFRP